MQNTTKVTTNLCSLEWLDKYKELVASGLSQRQACAILGIARATVYDTLIRVDNDKDVIVFFTFNKTNQRK